MGYPRRRHPVSVDSLRVLRVFVFHVVSRFRTKASRLRDISRSQTVGSSPPGPASRHRSARYTSEIRWVISLGGRSLDLPGGCLKCSRIRIETGVLSQSDPEGGRPEESHQRCLPP